MNSFHYGAAALCLCLLASPAANAEDDMSGMTMPEHHHDMAEHDFAFGHPSDGKAATRTVRIAMGDLSFTPAAITVKSGETIRFLIHNDSAADHDFTLGDKPTQEAHRHEMAEAAEAGKAMHHHHDGNARMVMAGKTQSLTWSFDQPGTVEYDCNVPGHFEAGMAGTITVTP
jgi:uncharacterized cupredoxin-like copper-binding protein